MGVGNLCVWGSLITFKYGLRPYPKSTEIVHVPVNLARKVVNLSFQGPVIPVTFIIHLIWANCSGWGFSETSPHFESKTKKKLLTNSYIISVFNLKIQCFILLPCCVNLDITELYWLRLSFSY